MKFIQLLQIIFIKQQVLLSEQWGFVLKVFCTISVKWLTITFAIILEDFCLTLETARFWWKLRTWLCQTNFKEPNPSTKFSGKVFKNCIQCSVKINLPNLNDIKGYLYKNRSYYIFFGMSFFIGIIIGIILSFTNESFYELLSSNKKLVFTIMNGTIDYLAFFWKVLIQFFCPLVLLLVLNLNYYLGLLSYLFVGYQAGAMVISYSAIITSYGFSGIFNVFCLLLPINIIYFACLIFYGVTCRTRSKQALFDKRFASGFDNDFHTKTIVAIVFVVLLSFLASVVIPLTLKTFTYIIF